MKKQIELPSPSPAGLLSPTIKSTNNDDGVTNIIKGTKKKKRKKRRKRRRNGESIINWFTTNQKTDYWNEENLNKLHLFIIILLIMMYTCHIIANPFYKFITDQILITSLNVIEIICLLLGIISYVKMCYVNGSWAAAKLIFNKRNIRLYIYIFWILRSFILEIFKGQLVYCFVHVFHSIVIYSTDAWYICNRRHLIMNLFLFVCIVINEFFISISPFRPTTPEWTFINIKTTPNSLSRTNQFNLFVIFFDALIVILFDEERAKYIMLVKKKKRYKMEISAEKKKKLNILWKIFCTAVSIGVILFMLNAMKIWPDTRLAYDLPLSTIAVLALITYSVVIYKSVKNPWKIVTYLLQERRIIFVLILLGILFYIDNVFMYGHPTGNGIAFPLLICALLSFDFLCCHFPRKISIITWTVSLLVLFWNIVDKTFVKTDCEVTKLPWGYMGTKVSYCNITRLIYQSILSLLLPAAFATLAKRTDNLFYCNANLYRSTGTTHRTTVNENTYVVSMTTERSFSKKKNVLGDKNVPGRARV